MKSILVWVIARFDLTRVRESIVLIHWWYFSFLGYIYFFGLTFVFKGVLGGSCLLGGCSGVLRVVLMVFRFYRFPWMRALICIESLRPGSFVGGGGGSGEGGVGGRGSGLITRQARNRRTSAQRFSRAVHPIFWFSFLSFFNLGNFNLLFQKWN